MSRNKLMTAQEVVEEFYDGMITAGSVRRKAHAGILPYQQICCGSKMLFERHVLQKLFKSRRFAIMPNVKER